MYAQTIFPSLIHFFVAHNKRQVSHLYHVESSLVETACVTRTEDSLDALPFLCRANDDVSRLPMIELVIFILIGGNWFENGVPG
jgi:hypothetical protein